MKKYILFTFAASILLLAGCSDVLEKYPLDKPSQETFYTNAIEITRGVNACYELLDEQNGGGYIYFPIMFDFMTDICYNRGMYAIDRGDFDNKDGIIVNTWSRSYQGISRCNTMLQVIEEKSSLLTDAQIKQFKGETLFLRAFYYARMAFLFGDVPLVLEPMFISDAMQVTRTPKAQIIDQVMKDFNEAASLLPDEYTASADKYRATKGVANAYKARYALYFGMYDVAAQAAQAVMSSGKYALYPRYGDLFVTVGLWDENNKEVLFRLDFSSVIGKYHSLPQNFQTRNETGWAIFVPSQQLVDSYDCIDGKNIAESPLFDKEHPFENRDPRLKLSIVVPGERFGDYRLESHVDSALCYQYSTGQMVQNKDCYIFTQYTSFTGYYHRKFNDESYSTKNTQGDYPIILCRYAEVLLTYAEARIELNQIDQSVVDALNLIRTGRDDVKMPAFTLDDLGNQNQARLKVRHERKIELELEGFRYADLKRWGWATTYLNRPLLGRPFKGAVTDWPDVKFDENGEPVYDYQNYEPHISSDYRIVETRMFTPGKHELWPVHEKELLLNPGLGQNPGW
ncbi:MAG: RagB/SusD family nutrient uptake outer membrane protein [Tannerella sp.]|jgi:hypothetical protein|nr:RagB/SusD family nutrient uptake outer membrane protein [Tannerella sp.]